MLEEWIIDKLTPLKNEKLIILVDRTREKAKLPLFYPDLEARCKSRARLALTLRDFLAENTGDQRWPGLVNSDRNLGGLVLDHLDQALQSHGQLRDVDEHRFQDSDLYKIVLRATLKVNPFKKLTAGDIRRLCIKSHDELERIKALFSTGAATEAGEVLGHLKAQIERADAGRDGQDTIRKHGGSRANPREQPSTAPPPNTPRLR